MLNQLKRHHRESEATRSEKVSSKSIVTPSFQKLWKNKRAGIGSEEVVVQRYSYVLYKLHSCDILCPQTLVGSGKT